MARSYPLAEIAKRLHQGRLILFVGAGMSRPHFPDWVGLLKDLQTICFKDDPEGAEEVGKLIDEKQFLAAAWAIDRKSEGAWRDHVQQAFRELPGAAKGKDYQSTKAKYDALKDLPFSGAITTNYDAFLDPHYPSRRILPSQRKEVVEFLREPAKLLKLHGEAADRESLVLTTLDFRTLRHDSPELALTMEAAARLYSFLFVGYSMQDEDLMVWLEHVCHRTHGKGGHHYALVRPEDWGKYRREQYAKLYDIHMVDADPDANGRPDIVRFFTELRAELEKLHAADVPQNIQKIENLTPWQEADQYVDPLVLPENRSLNKVFLEWLNDDKSPFLAVLGEFGTGKTWFSKQARKLVAESTTCKRQPCLVELGKGLFKHNAGESEFREAFGEHFTTANETGQLLLILDAFDEMAKITSETLTEKFERLRFLGKGKAKVVLTCRSELFATSKEEHDKIHADWARKVYVQPFDDARINQVLKNQENGARVRAWIDTDAELKGLAGRPLFLPLLLAADGNVRPTRNQLFENFVNNVLKRGEEHIQLRRREFAKQLAWRLQSTGARSLSAAEVDALAAKILGACADPAEVLRTRSRALLVRKGDEYEFGHLSFQEYLVAEQLADKLYAGECEEIPLSDPIIAFLRESRPMPKQEPIEKDGMVWIPPGPFIYGGGKNSCVKNLDKGFWMDKYPVTNEAFARFLDSGLKIDKMWFEDEENIRSEKLARHPIVNVSWHGAKAYAAWQKKELPTEEQWEKAARGVDGRAYPWGDEFDKNLCNTRESGKGTTTPADEYPGGVSPYGCREMAGNVWEWMENPYSAGSKSKSVRGGAWNYNSNYTRCAIGNFYPEVRNNDLGFRCSRTSP